MDDMGFTVKGLDLEEHRRRTGCRTHGEGHLAEDCQFPEPIDELLQLCKQWNELDSNPMPMTTAATLEPALAEAAAPIVPGLVADLREALKVLREVAAARSFWERADPEEMIEAEEGYDEAFEKVRALLAKHPVKP